MRRSPSQTFSAKLAVALACGALGGIAAFAAGGCGEDRGSSGTGTGGTGTGTGETHPSTTPSTTPTTESTPTTTTK
ncbi:MAG TPA: hypothetical protein VFN38_03810 [Gemmatimonadaceae bacterium]|nr:hypothetical protein [Gemmatimonadaceae bacterium]